MKKTVNSVTKSENSEKQLDSVKGGGQKSDRISRR